MKNQKIIVASAVVLTLLSAALVGYLIYELMQKPPDPASLIGDSGAMQFFIPRENLKKRDFSEILYWWDCH